jgi:hypothetical protein
MTLAVTPGSGATMLTDDTAIAGTKIAVSKIELGASGTDGGFVSATNPMPSSVADGGNVTVGSKADAAVTNPASSGSLIALIKGLFTGIVLAAGNATLGAMYSACSVTAGSTVTRQANTTAYAIGQLISAYASAANVNANPVAIGAARGANVTTAAVRCRLTKTGTGTGNAYFRVHFWNAAPTVANGDAGNFSANLDSTYCGSFDVNCTKQGSGGCWGAGNPTDGVAVVFSPVTGTSNLYYLIEARGAYTPASGEVFTAYLETV